MLVFDLICSNGHRFEAWFKNYDAFQEQKDAGLVTCAVCCDDSVDIELTGGHIVKAPAPIQPVKKQEEKKEKLPELKNIDMVSLVKTINHYVKKNCKDVGEKFPEEARKIHHGESEEKNIFGTATEEERKELSDEGIPFAAIPALPESLDN